MNCEEVRASLSPSIDNELIAELAAGLSAHLEGCSVCSAELAKLKSASRMVRDLPLRPLPPGFLQRLDKKRRGLAPDGTTFSLFSPQPLAFASAALVVGWVVAGPWKSHRLAQAPGQPLSFKTTQTSTPLAELSGAGDLGPAPAAAPARGPVPAPAPEPAAASKAPAADESLYVGAASQEADQPAEPFLGEHPGQPGTRAKAEVYIRQFAAMRRSVEANSGKAGSVPIEGSVAPVIGSAQKERPLEDGFWSGDYSGGNEGTRVVADAASWKSLWATLASGPPPLVDFASSQVLAVFLGPRPTGGYSVEFTEIKATSGALLVRYREHVPSDTSANDGATSAYALKVAAKSGLPVRFEKVR